MKTETTIWNGKPSYVFRITMLESDGHYDAMSGSTSPFIIYLLFCIAISTLVFTTMGAGAFFLLFIALVIIGLMGPDIFIWNRRSKQIYRLMTESILVTNLHNETLAKIAFANILNIYSVRETRRLETIVITHQATDSDKVLKTCLWQIESAENVEEQIKKAWKNQNSGH